LCTLDCLHHLPPSGPRQEQKAIGLRIRIWIRMTGTNNDASNSFQLHNDLAILSAHCNDRQFGLSIVTEVVEDLHFGKFYHFKPSRNWGIYLQLKKYKTRPNRNVSPGVNSNNDCANLWSAVCIKCSRPALTGMPHSRCNCTASLDTEVLQCRLQRR
jgi:hypothetical protein